MEVDNSRLSSSQGSKVERKRLSWCSSQGDRETWECSISYVSQCSLPLEEGGGNEADLLSHTTILTVASTASKWPVWILERQFGTNIGKPLGKDFYSVLPSYLHIDKPIPV